MEREQNRTHLLACIALFLLFGFVRCVCWLLETQHTDAHEESECKSESSLFLFFRTTLAQLPFSLAKIVQVIDLLRVPTNKRELTR